MTSTSQVFETVFILASARRSRCWILSRLWCSGFRMSHSVVQGTGGHVVPSLGLGPVHLNPAFSIALLFKPRPRLSTVMSQHSRQQINELVVAADEQRREGCLWWQDGERKQQRAGATVWTWALSRTPTQAMLATSVLLERCVLGGCGDNNQFKCL